MTTTSYSAIRDNAALIDVSHHGRIKVTGDGAEDLLSYAVGANLADLFEGRMVNTLMAAEDGTLLAIIWLIRFDDHFMIIVDRDDKEAALSQLGTLSGGYEAAFEDVTDATFDLCVAGPSAEEAIAEIFGDDIYTVPFQSFEPMENFFAVRYGMIGEYEIHFIGDVADKASTQDKILSGGGGAFTLVSDEAYPVLVTEMRNIHKSLHVPKGYSIFEAGIQWMVDFRKDDFCGRSAIEAQKDTVKRRGVLLVSDTDPVEPGTAISIEGKKLGEYVCAFPSPHLSKTVGYAYIDDEFAWPGLTFEVDGKGLGETVSAPAFLTKSVLNTIS